MGRDRLSAAELEVVCAEVRADIDTRIRAARLRYGANDMPGGARRAAWQVVGMLCVIAATWRRRLKKWRCGTTTTR